MARDLQVLGGVVDRVVGAPLAAQLELLGARSGCDDPGPEQPAELDRREPDGAAGAQHQQRLTRLQAAPVLQAVETRAIRVVETGDDGEVDGIGNTAGRGRTHRRQLGVAADRAEAADETITDGPTLDALAELGDDTGDLTPRDVRRDRLVLVLVLDHQRVGERHSRRGDRDEEIAGPGARVVDLLDDQPLRRSELMTYDGSHAR